MNIYAEYGDKVVARHLDNGWDSDKEKAHKYLEQDKEYTIKFTDVHSCSTDVYLMEIPDVAFNSVHFEDVPTSEIDAMYGISVVYTFECCRCKKENLLNTDKVEQAHCTYCGKINTMREPFDLEDLF